MSFLSFSLLTVDVAHSGHRSSVCVLEETIKRVLQSILKESLNVFLIAHILLIPSMSSVCICSGGSGEDQIMAREGESNL